MIRNYFKVALRNIWKSKGFSAINILGLAIGLATCMIILMYVKHELSYDRYNKHFDRIYRLDCNIRFGGSNLILAVGPAPLGPVLKKDDPEVEQYVRFRSLGGILVKKGNENIQESRVIFADSTLFKVFTLPMIAGNPATALVAPNSIVITASMAMKYFNSTEVIGKTLLINDSSLYRITGVIRDIPSRSHFHFDFFLPLSSQRRSRSNNWLRSNFNTYILLRKGTSPVSLESKFPGMVRKYVGPQVEQLMHVNLDQLKAKNNYMKFSLMPLGRIHLYSNKVGEIGANSDVEYIYIFSAIALFILMIACINFMNLSTARSSGRAREVGIRKVLGSLRSNLITQFLAESLLITGIAMLFAILLATLLLPYFNELAGKKLHLDLFRDPEMIPGMLILLLIVGLLAGSYPAFFLSSFRPVEVLKGKLASGFRSGWLRNSLVVFQFVISIVLIVGTIVIYSQLSYIRNKDLGYDRNHVLIINNCYPLGNQAPAFRADISGLAGVSEVTMTGFLPTANNDDETTLFKGPTLAPQDAISMQWWKIDENYIPVLSMKIVQGRNFSSQFPSDSDAVILNGAAVKLLGWKDPINKKLFQPVGNHLDATIAWNVIGVVKDFNFNSLRQQVTPMALILGTDEGSIALKINTADIQGLIHRINGIWSSMAPGQPFSYSFMNDDFNRIYQSEQRTGQIFISFAILAVFIACLGLFGLVTYAAEQRFREIGIRKTLGASVMGIIAMMSTDLLKLVLIALVIATPIAWWAMNQWLLGFAFHVALSWRIFLLSGFLAICIALVSISMQTLKAAMTNPVQALRSE